MSRSASPSQLLDGKVVIVIGGSGLLGRDFVRGIAEHGGHPVVADLNIQSDSKHFTVNVDINSKESVSQLIEAVHHRYGRIDAVVNSAYPRNANYGKAFFEVTHEDFCENVSLNLGGVFLICQKLAEYFKNQGYGNIVNIASIYGVITPKFDLYKDTSMTMPIEYASIKSALIHLTKYIAKYLSQLNIRANLISPGGILDQQPQAFINAYNKLCFNNGLMAPSDVTGTLIFLLSDMAPYINGQNIIVDDGITV